MHGAQALVALGAAFVLCGVLARAASRTGVPTIPLFMLAGLAVGPFTPGFTLVDDPDDLALVASLGLVFLLFYLGLEFSPDDLTAGGRRLAGSAAFYLALNIGCGTAFAVAVGWGGAEALVVAGVVGISSSAMVTKLLVEQRRLANPETRVILGVIVLEDLFLAFYLAMLQPVLGGAEGTAEAVRSVVVAFAFLAALAGLARWGTRWVDRLVATRDDEVLVVLSVGLAVVVAGAAELIGVSAAIGAFMTGMILGAGSAGRRLRGLTHPLRDAFGAIFFVHFGLGIDPGDVLGVAPQVLGAAVLTVVLGLLAGAVAARLHGFGRRRAATIGLTVLCRGEFSLVLAALAVAAGLDARIAAFAAGYVLLLAVAGPVAGRFTDPVARLLPRRLVPGSDDDPDRPLDLVTGAGGLHELGTELVRVRIPSGSRLHGVELWELRLPAGATAGLVARRGTTFAPVPSTQLLAGDVVLVFVPPDTRREVHRRIALVHRGGRLAEWHGSAGPRAASLAGSRAGSRAGPGSGHAGVGTTGGPVPVRLRPVRTSPAWRGAPAGRVDLRVVDLRGSGGTPGRSGQPLQVVEPESEKLPVAAAKDQE